MPNRKIFEFCSMLHVQMGRQGWCGGRVLSRNVRPLVLWNWLHRTQALAERVTERFETSSNWFVEKTVVEV